MQQAIIVVQSLIIIGLALALGATFPGGFSGCRSPDRERDPARRLLRSPVDRTRALLRREESVSRAVQLLLLNPVDWAVQAGREAVGSDVDWSQVLSYGGYVLAFTLVSAWLAARAFRAYQRSV